MSDNPEAHHSIDAGEAALAACRALGFALAGIAPAAFTSREPEFRAWLDAGKHGVMEWMTQLLDERLDIRRMLPGARSVLMVADLYARRGSDGPAPAGAARVARYARGLDYHAVMKRRLHRVAAALRARHPGHEFRTFVDSGPVLEREHAYRAGLGWVGKHTLLIHPRLGSYFALGGIVTTLEMRQQSVSDPSAPMAGIVPDHCGTCTRCIEACPTGAITPYSVDARRCISYLTIEHAPTIDPALQDRMGEWGFGCDICQEVCPFNAPRPGDAPYPAYRDELGVGAHLDVAGVLNWGRAAHRRAVSGSAMKRATLPMLKRNAAIVGRHVLRDGREPEIVAAARRVAGDECEAPAVREEARKLGATLPEG